MTEAVDYLIKKGSYFYRPNKQGYTSFKFDAGRYTKADAEAEASVEPWHMKSIHQDDVPEDTAPDKHISGLHAEINRLRALLYHADSFVIDGITEAKSQVERNAPYPTRLPRFQAQLDEARQLHADITEALKGVNVNG
jgi:hypothetical protein